MVSAVELRRIAAFSDLPDGQIDWFLSHAEEMILQVNTVIAYLLQLAHPRTSASFSSRY